MSTERRGLDALGMVTEMPCFFSLDCRDAAFTASAKKVLHIFIFLTFLIVLRESLYIQDGYKLYCSSKEQRLYTILPLVN